MSHGNHVAKREPISLAEAFGFASILAGAVGSGTAASASTLAAALLGVHARRSADRERARATRLVQEIAIRVKMLEHEKRSEEQFDLFTHLLQAAIKDDDERKLEYHAAFIAWTLNTKPDPEVTRLVGHAICQMTHAELLYFMSHMFGQGVRLVSPYFDEHAARARLASFGVLSANSVITRGDAPMIGKQLASACKSLKTDEEWWKLELRR